MSCTSLLTAHLFTANALMIIFEQFRTFFRSYFSQLSISSLMFVYLRLALWCRRGDVGFVHLVNLNDLIQIKFFYNTSLSFTWYFLNWKWHKHHKKCKWYNATFVSLQLLTDFATKIKRSQRLPNRTIIIITTLYYIYSKIQNEFWTTDTKLIRLNI